MLIIGELRGLRQNFISNSSLKEQTFYKFLVNEPLSYPAKNDLTEIEQICYSAFCTDIPSNINLRNLVGVQRRTQPIGGMHYTKNLIELIAMAKANIIPEKENLKSYCENHSTRDFYILNSLFPDILANPPSPQGSVDKIALYLYKGKSPQDGWNLLLLKALYETADLIDLYVIEQGYLQGMYDNPIVHKTEAIRHYNDLVVSFSWSMID